MSWDLRPEEQEAVLELPAPKRYAYLIKRAADWEEVWGLRDERGWVTASDDAGRKFLPIWPHPAYASESAKGAWATAEPAPIGLDELLGELVPHLESEGRMVSVFPLPDGNGVPVDPGRLRGDLEAENTLYE